MIGTTTRTVTASSRAAYEGFKAPVLELSPSRRRTRQACIQCVPRAQGLHANELSRWTERLGKNVTTWSPRSEPTRGSGLLSCGGRGAVSGEAASTRTCKRSIIAARSSESREGRIRSAETALAIQCQPNDQRLRAGRCCPGTLRGKTVAMLGLAFKAGTDNVRRPGRSQSPSDCSRPAHAFGSTTGRAIQIRAGVEASVLRPPVE